MTRRRLLLPVALAVGALFVGSTGAHAADSAAATSTPTLEGPVTGGKGTPTIAATSFDLASVGYEQAEYFMSGTATSYTSAAPLASDGKWTATPGETAAYKTRLLVYRPTNAKTFNGTVVVEWDNVSGGLDAAPNWTLDHVELIREGMAWVGVTAQKVGIDGSPTSIAGSFAPKNADPERYGSLVHPGDSFSYDIFTQAGASVRGAASTLLGGLKPKKVIAVGESQSAFRLTTYVNVFGPTSKVFDGYLIHSRAASGSALAQAPQPAVAAPTPTFIRTDLKVPVMVFTTEADLMALNYLPARQPDSKFLRDWEVAGAAHADTYSLGVGGKDTGDGTGDAAEFQTMLTPPASPYPGILDCATPINAGPHTYVLRAAIADLNRWITTGKAPPKSPRLQENTAQPGTFMLDANGNALGGIRTPQVDVPVAVLSGIGQAGSRFCSLFGTTMPFDAAKLGSLYPTHAAFVNAWNQATDKAVKAGFLLPLDAKHIKAAAAQSTIGKAA